MQTMRAQGVLRLKVGDFELEVAAISPDAKSERLPQAVEEVDPNFGLTKSEMAEWFASSG